MLRYILSYLITFVILFNNTGSFAETDKKNATEPNKEKIEMPDGFKNIHLEMSLKEFLKVRPNVKPYFKTKIDPEKKDQMLGEYFTDYPKEPMYGALYFFSDSKLTQIVIIEEKNIKEMQKARKKFLSSCIKKWGSKFEKKLGKINEIDKKFVPTMVWDKGKIKISAQCTPGEQQGITRGRGTLTIGIFLKDKHDTVFKKLLNEKADKKTIDKMFKSIGVDNQEKDKKEPEDSINS